MAKEIRIVDLTYYRQLEADYEGIKNSILELQARHLKGNINKSKYLRESETIHKRANALKGRIDAIGKGKVLLVTFLENNLTSKIILTGVTEELARTMLENRGARVIKITDIPVDTDLTLFNF